MGQMAAGNNKRTGNAGFGVSMRFICFMLLLLVAGAFVIDVSVTAQSGRIKGKTSKEAGSRNQKSDSTNTTSKTPSAKPSPSNQNNQETKESEEVADEDIVRVSSNLVPIPASVVDAKGFAMTGLKLDDFELRVDGQIKPISDMTRSETVVRLAMLYDNSGSTHPFREFEKRAAMRFFRQVLRPIDQAAVFSIGSDVYLAQPLTSNVMLLERTIETFGVPAGATSLFDGIVDAAAYLRPFGGRRVLVIVSDGIETGSRHDFETTMQKALADDCQIFIVQTGLYEDANLRALVAERRMEQLAGQTGGAVYVPKTTDELDHAFQQIAADLAQQYVLSYYPGAERRDGRFHAIDLRVKAKKDLRVRARKGYYSPKSAEFAAGEF